MQIKAPRTLKEESPPAWLEDDEEDGTSPKKLNSFPKTLIPLTDLGILQGSEHLRNFQKPSAAARKRQNQYQHPLELVALTKDIYQNKNMIKTFCGRCGTHLFWKSPHDVSRQVYINLHCLQSDWRLMPLSPKKKASFSSRKAKAIAPPRSLPAASRKEEAPSQSSAAKAASPLTTPKARNKTPSPPPQDLSETEPELVSALPPRHSSTGTTFLNSYNVNIHMEHTKPHPVTPPRSRRGRSNSLFREHSTSLTDDELSWAEKDAERPTDASETASTITFSSNSVVWRLRDPNSNHPHIPSPSSRSVGSTWEERLNDELSHDALLYQMRKHLSSHNSSNLSDTTTDPPNDGSTFTPLENGNANGIGALNSTGEGPRVFLPAD